MAIVTQAISAKASAAEDTRWPFYYAIQALNALVAAVDGRADPTTIVLPTVRPFTFSIDAVNAIAKFLKGDTSASAVQVDPKPSWFEDLAYPFQFTINQLNYLVAKYNGAADPTTIVIPTPAFHASATEDTRWPFRYKISALNALAIAFDPSIQASTPGGAFGGVNQDTAWPFSSLLQGFNSISALAESGASQSDRLTTESGNPITTESGDHLILE